jgi:Ca2+-binding RTX toxin-like protein
MGEMTSAATSDRAATEAVLAGIAASARDEAAALLPPAEAPIVLGAAAVETDTPLPLVAELTPAASLDLAGPALSLDVASAAMPPADVVLDRAHGETATFASERLLGDAAPSLALMSAASDVLLAPHAAVAPEATVAILAPPHPVEGITIPAETIAAASAQLLATGGASITAQSDTSLIHLDQFRSDLRFAGIDGSGVSVVVIDTGIDLNHSFFGSDANSNGVADRIVFQYDFSGSNDADASDTNGHGSNVASIVGSQDATYTGMAPGCNIIALKVFPDGNASASTSDIQEALNWVVANRAAYNIVSVNMSLGYSDNLNSPSSSPFAANFASLAANNCAVVVASGNSYYQFQAQGVATPSADPNAWSVGAVWDRNAGSFNWASGASDFSTGADRITSFSQRSTTMSTIFAPGGQITGAYWNGGLSTYSGTSQATPHIAGLVADMQELAVQVSGHLLSVTDLRTTMVSSSATIIDGDDENDNVANTGGAYHRVDAYAWGIAVLSQLFAGTAAVDTLTGTGADDVIHGQGNNDSLNGAGGNDTLYGEAGNDSLDGGSGTDTASYANAGGAVTVNLAAGTATGAAGSDTLTSIENIVGSTSGDTLTGNSSANVLDGGGGDDTLNGGGGADTLIGGGGNDTYVIASAGVTITEAAGGGTDTVQSSISFSIAALANVENLTLTGSANIDGTGNGGDNVLTGNSGVNTLDGGSGNDTLDGGAGADVMRGGAGSDTYYVDNAGDTVEEASSSGTTAGAVLDWRNVATGAIELWTMNGATRLSVATPSVASLTTDWKLVGDGDFNGDGKSDLLWRNTVSGQNQVWFMDGSTVTGSASLSYGAVPVDWQIVGTGNFNGDNQTDILWRNQTTGDSGVWYMNGTTLVSSEYLSLSPIPTNWQIVGTGNFNGDSSTDIVWRNTTDGTTLVWYMNGSTYVNYSYLSQQVVPLNMTVAATADFTGDGKTDIVWRNTSTGATELWTMDGATRTALQALSVQNADLSWKPFAAHAQTVISGSSNGDVDTVHSSLASYTLPTGVENLILDPGAVNGTGNSGANRITGNSLDNILTGGGGDDIFAFLDANGSDRITDFNASGQGSDKIDLSGRTTHLTFADVISHASNSGGNAVVALDAQSTITIVGKLVSDLQASHFVL